MNDISFRAWHIEREWMYDVTSISFKTATVGIEYDGMAERVPINEVALLPFIGLIDTKGRRIYEGDVVECISEPWEKPTLNHVRVSNGRVMYGDYLAYSVFKEHEFVHVVGDIYSNPKWSDLNKRNGVTK